MKQSNQTVVERYAEWLLLALIFFLPLQTRWIALPGTLNDGPWEYGTVSVYAVDFIVVAVLLFAGAHLLAERKFYRPSLSQWVVILLMVLTFFSIGFADNRINGLFWWVKFMEGAAFFLFIPQLRLHRRRIAYALLGSSVIQSLLAFQQVATQKVFGNRWLGMSTQDPSQLGVVVVESAGERLLRAYGSLPHPNMLAGWLVVGLLAGLYLIMTEQRRSWRIAALVGTVFTSVGLWTTLSRQGILALGLTIGVFILYTFLTQSVFPRRAAFAVTTVLLPFFVCAALFPNITLTRTGGDTRLEHHSIAERQLYLEQSEELLRTDWVTGVGIGNYTAELHRRDTDADITKEADTYQPVHIIYVLLFTELGVFGLVAFLCFICSLVYHRRWRNPAVVSWGLPFLALLVIGLFDHYLWSLHFGILFFWLTAALYENVTVEKSFDE